MLNKYKVGNIVTGTVSGIEPYGFFVKFDEYYSGLVHISEMSDKFVKDPNDFVKIDDLIKTKIIEVDEEHFHLKLSIKNLDYRIKKNKELKKIVETPNGFKTLEYKLKLWIKEGLEKLGKMN